jgi:hypothetical protein
MAGQLLALGVTQQLHWSGIVNSQVWRKSIVASIVTFSGLFVGGASVLALGVFDSGPHMETVAFALPTMSEPASLVLFGASLWALASWRRRTPQKSL